MAAAIIANRLSRASIPHSGRRLIRSERMATSRMAAWVNTPSVVPMPSTNSFALPICTGSTESSPGTTR